MEELAALILTTGTRVIISEEDVLGGLKRPLVVNYVSIEHGVVTETWEYVEEPMSRAWGAIKSVNYQVTSANDIDVLLMQKERRNGGNVLNDLFIALKNQNLTVSDTATLLNKLLSVVVLISVGRLEAAKVIANQLNTDSLYTNVRKTWLLSRLQEEIDKL